ncbi:conserved hypothetical protein [Burkholderia pseudomallei Pakistan 9]|nr:conserved hypothetical protein [Burkholderia pseudomallei Pakistan 9]
MSSARFSIENKGKCGDSASFRCVATRQLPVRAARQCNMKTGI